MGAPHVEVLMFATFAVASLALLALGLIALAAGRRRGRACRGSCSDVSWLGGGAWHYGDGGGGEGGGADGGAGDGGGGS